MLTDLNLKFFHLRNAQVTWDAAVIRLLLTDVKALHHKIIKLFGMVMGNTVMKMKLKIWVR